jgi:cytochrome c556
MQNDILKNENPTDANNVLADSASFWMNADKSTVQKYLKEKLEDMDEYNRKKKEIMKRCFERTEQRFEQPNGVSNKFFIWTMLAMAILGLVAAWLSL